MAKDPTLAESFAAARRSDRNAQLDGLTELLVELARLIHSRLPEEMERLLLDRRLVLQALETGKRRSHYRGQIAAQRWSVGLLEAALGRTGPETS